MKFKKIDVIYGHDLSLVHGVNYVTNMLLHGQSIFRANGFELHKIYHCRGSFDCLQNSNIYADAPINKSQARSYSKRKLIDFLKKSFLYKNSLMEFLLIYLRMIIPARKTIINYCSNLGDQSSYIIFQDPLSAFFYFKYGIARERRKTILILHTTEDLYECLKKDRPHFCSNKLMFTWYQKMEQKAIDQVDKVVFLSHRAANGVLSIPKGKKVVIHNGIENYEYDRVAHSCINIVSVGSVLERKGQRYIIDALKYFSKTDISRLKLYIVGNGNDFDYCQNLVKKYKLEDSVIFTGLSQNVPEILKSMDIFILPSASEGLPISIIEALRQGLFIMTTDVGGCREMIDSRTGVIISRDAFDIKEKLMDTIHDKKKLLQAQIYSRKMFEERFELKIMIDNYSRLFMSL